MARVHPFTALRYVSGVEPRLTWSPFTAKLSDRLADPLSSLALLGQGDAAARLQEWSRSGELVEESPGMYVLEVERLEARPGGPVGAARYLIAALEEGDALAPLEQEAPDLRVPQAEIAPVLAADDQRALEEALAAASQPPPRNEWIADGWRLRMWKLADAQAWSRFDALLNEMPLRPLVQLRAGGRVMAAIAPLANDRLDLRPIHRGLARLETFNPQRFLSLVKDYARVYELERPLTSPNGLDSARAQLAALSTRSHVVLAVLPQGQSRILRFRQDLDLFHLKAAPRSPTLRSLDLALLESVMFRTVLGLKSPESPSHPNLFPVAPISRLIEDVDTGVYQAGFGLNAPPRWELRAVMEAAQQLPPKTVELDGAPPAGLLFLAS